MTDRAGAGYSQLALKPATRSGGGGKTAREFLDILVDGKSLYEEFRSTGHDLISCLGWGSLKAHQESVDRLLLRAAPDFKNGRNSLFVCPECGGLDCGAISILITMDAVEVRWKDFGYENTYDEETPLLGSYAHLPELRFRRADYESVLTESLKNLKLPG